MRGGHPPHIPSGSDRLAARILRELAGVLALPLTILCRRILYEAFWPTRWRVHLVIPIYKKAAVSDAGNYRGIHLTSIVSKCVERVIGQPLIAFLEAHGFGSAQWAFRKKSSARDLSLVCVSRWSLAFCRKCKMGAYLGDISGAFDRVFKDFLLAKLSSVGVADVFLDFLNSYLEPRVGRVAIEDVLSDAMTLCDSIFQGTVLGPALWNPFFHDVVGPASFAGEEVALFADDLTSFKAFPIDKPNNEIEEEMRATRSEVHRWGKQNRVSFDSDKEHINILHPLHGQGETFKLLGCPIDVKLTMSEAVDLIVARARPKIKALLRSRAFYSLVDLIVQIKTHIWGIIDYSHGCVLHASDTALAKIDHLQSAFVRELHVTEEFVFLVHNFAPGITKRHWNFRISSQESAWRVSSRYYESVAFLLPKLCLEAPQTTRNLFSELCCATCPLLALPIRPHSCVQQAARLCD